MRTTTAATLLLFTSVALFWSGCGDDETARSLSKKTELEADSRKDVAPTPQKVPGTSLTELGAAKIAIPGAIDIQPANGTFFGRERTSTLSLHFTGFTVHANEKVEVQVLGDPAAPIGEGNWVTIATTTSAATGTQFNDPAPVFRYDVEATPGADGRWREGGVLRYRTVVTDAAGKRTLLPFFDASSGACVAAAGTRSWKDVVSLCKSPFSPALGAELGSTTRAAALVSGSRQPEEVFLPGFLSRRGFIEATETDLYYDRVDAPRSLAEFRFRFGFDTNREVDAFYYNLGDLGIGREVHCTTFDRGNGFSGTACYVRNYGVNLDGSGAFSGDPQSAMADLLAQQGSFASVCMVKFGSTLADPQGNDVQFFVYDANERIVNRAELDSFGSNDAIPNNCLNCHGGKYDRTTSTITGASFLPFDPEAFLYADEAGIGFDEQEEVLRQLNDMMKSAGAPPTTKQYVDGIYDNKSAIAGTRTNLDFIPAGWAGSEEAKTVYREVYKPYCRTCHTSQFGAFAFMTYDDFKSAANESMHSVCDTMEMPLAEATMINFWASPARAYLFNALDRNASCAPEDR